MIDINNILLMSIATGVVCLKGVQGKDWEYQHTITDNDAYQQMVELSKN